MVRERGLEAAGIAALALCFVACSGKSTSHGGDDGTGGNATGGSGGGGSAKLGLNLLLRNPDPTVPETAGRSCPTSTGVEWDIGVPIERDGMVVDVDSPTPTDFGSTLTNGGLTHIACIVRADGTFTLDGSGTDPLIAPPDGYVQLTAAGYAETNAEVDVSIYTPRTFSLRTASGFPSCRLTAVHEHAPGALWADIDCPALTSPSEPSMACRASGTLVVEYCETGEN